MQKSMKWVVKNVSGNPYFRFPISFDAAAEKGWHDQVITKLEDDFSEGLAQIRGTELVIRVTVDEDILEGGLEHVLMSRLYNLTTEPLGTPRFRHLHDGLKILNDI